MRVGFQKNVGVNARRVSARRAMTVTAAAGKSPKITLLPGDGIGPEIMDVAVKVCGRISLHVTSISAAFLPSLFST